ncbi:chloride channel protein [Roseibium sp. RKSG952]|uniref:chloride channel protein n=1 Tax=Roseibium sp. RKSG952 TaxID=2529384 RepID=UPI0012BB9A0B|nr:chloride channel protein [Roseibium sp. RKSG952]MTH97906.1 chloride channel protein [Roseibium sp. RKSG952]
MQIIPDPLRRLPQILKTWISPNLRMFLDSRMPTVWVLSLVIGVLVAVAAILFRMGIGLIQWTWLGTTSEKVMQSAIHQPWWLILSAPAAGGLIVGLLLQFLTKKQRTGGVADVIEARALGGRGLPLRDGLMSALITVISLGFGASAGREGPVVHLGATLGTALCRVFSLPDSARRILLACGVASAISASFNAPIAGVLFAHEVVLGHYALSAFVPIVLSATVGTVLAIQYFGNAAAFEIPAFAFPHYSEIPAFALLGVVCAIVAIVFQFSLIGTDWFARNIRMPLWLRPVVGGFAVGAIAIAFPGVLGVGYGATDLALKEELPFLMLIGLVVAKTAATAITLASRFGGGIFSPSLYLGAMAGGAFGIVAAAIFPESASSQTFYSILGMGAVAAAMLGAPISTTMIVFELTGGYALSISLLLTVSISTGLTHLVHGKSFFHWQLETRGVCLHEGAHQYLRETVKVRDFMDPPPEKEEDRHFSPGGGRPYLHATDTLESALKTFDAGGHEELPVVASGDAGRIIGIARHVKALSYFNKALIQVSEEEHR